jgi:hypothetical protein
MVRRHTCTVLSALFVAGFLACNSPKSIQGPTPNPTPTPTPTPTPPTLTRVLLSGNVSLTDLGQTSQLTATATFSDSSTQDVTSNASWFSSDTRVATVSGGLVTVINFGQAFVSVNYSGRGTGATVKATPPGTFVIAGWVREPGQGPLPEVDITETGSGRIISSDQDGNVSFGDVRALPAHLSARKNGYEAVDFDATAAIFFNQPLQRIIRVAAGEKATPPDLAPNDTTYRIGSVQCYDCRLIRLTTDRAGTVRVQVVWIGPKLSLFAGDQVVESASPLVAEIPVDAARELVIYLGNATSSAITSHMHFTIETSMQ